jgi:hypothetical protein
MMRNIFPNGTKIDIALWQISLNNQSHLQKDDVFVTLEQNRNSTMIVQRVFDYLRVFFIFPHAIFE